MTEQNKDATNVQLCKSMSITGVTHWRKVTHRSRNNSRQLHPEMPTQHELQITKLGTGSALLSVGSAAGRRAPCPGSSASLLFTGSLVCLFLFFFFFFDRASLYSPGCPGAHYVDQAGLELRDLFASESQVQGSKACATMHKVMVFNLVIVRAWMHEYALCGLQSSWAPAEVISRPGAAVTGALEAAM